MCTLSLPSSVPIPPNLNPTLPDPMSESAPFCFKPEKQSTDIHALTDQFQNLDLEGVPSPKRRKLSQTPYAARSLATNELPEHKPRKRPTHLARQGQRGANLSLAVKERKRQLARSCTLGKKVDGNPCFTSQSEDPFSEDPILEEVVVHNMNSEVSSLLSSEQKMDFSAKTYHDFEAFEYLEAKRTVVALAAHEAAKEALARFGLTISISTPQATLEKIHSVVQRYLHLLPRICGLYGTHTLFDNLDTMTFFFSSLYLHNVKTLLSLAKREPTAIELITSIEIEELSSGTIMASQKASELVHQESEKILKALPPQILSALPSDFLQVTFNLSLKPGLVPIWQPLECKKCCTQSSKMGESPQNTNSCFQIFT